MLTNSENVFILQTSLFDCSPNGVMLRETEKPTLKVFPPSICPSVYPCFLGSGPDRGQSPVEWGDFPSVRPSIRPSIRPYIRTSVRTYVPPLEGPRASQAGLRPSQSGLRASQAGLRASQAGLRASEAWLAGSEAWLAGSEAWLAGSEA